MAPDGRLGDGVGADMDEGVLVEWLVHPGDTVHKGQIIAVVDTAKANI